MEDHKNLGSTMKIKPGTLIQLIGKRTNPSRAFHFYKAHHIDDKKIKLNDMFSDMPEGDLVKVEVGEIFLYVGEKLGTHPNRIMENCYVFLNKNGVMFYETKKSFIERLEIYWKIATTTT